MAALTETNITTTIVGNALGNASRNVGVLCTASTINQWSKKKPVREHGSPNWWEATNPLYGSGVSKFSILMSPLTNGLDDLSYTANSYWTYERPLGDYSTYPASGFRLGDFRGYDHASIPAINVNTYPTGNVRDHVSRSWDEIINTASAGITVSDFGISAYYFGILIEWGASYEYKYVQTVATPLSSGAASIAFDYHITPFSSSYVGTYRWTSFICSQEITNGEAERWQTLAAAQAAHTGEVVIITPATSTGITGTNGGTFTSSISITSNSYSTTVGSNATQVQFTITVTPTNTPTTSTASQTWIGIPTTQVLNSVGSFTLTVNVAKNLTGSSRSGTITIEDDWGEATPIVITINQLATPI